MIAVVDYGVNNLASVRNAFRAAGSGVTVTSKPADIARADAVVLPGIGSAAAGMDRIRQRGLEDVLRSSALSGRPFLGICLGMQLLFEQSEEGGVPCLAILPGWVRLLPGTVKVPQIGWNRVEVTAPLPLWRGLPRNPYLYFVHSYVCEPAERSLIAGETEYGGRFCSAVFRESIWGTQFHPERSGRTGLHLIANFIAACRPARAPAEP